MARDDRPSRGLTDGLRTQLSRTSLYLDAARSLRWSQLIGRVRRLIPPRVIAAGLTTATSPEWRPVVRGLACVGAPQYGDVPPAHETGIFEAYGARRAFPSPSFWTDRRDGLLYLFHLHGFDALAVYATGPGTAKGDLFWRNVVESWLACERRPRHPSWHPYPTSQRLIAWSTALSELDRWPLDFRQRLATEIHRQARYLRRTVEHDIGGNHVLKNATALCFAGTVVPESEVLDAGLRLLGRECARQFFADGGHEERSTSYHRQAVADLEAVSRLLEQSGLERPRWLQDTVTRASHWQRALTGPDGRLPLLGDSWEGPPTDVRLTEPATLLADSGYVVLRHAGDQLVIDAGALCPPHLPPHAHADCLSFVLWADGEPLIVDPGSYTYAGSDRDAFRGTAAHNTVEVAGRDQCVFWGPFRAAFLPKISGPTIRRSEEVVLVEASHDGYGRLADPVVHHRSFVWWPPAGLVVVDRLVCREPQEAVSRLCLAPGVVHMNPFRVGSLAVTEVGGGQIEQERRQYSPALGARLETIGLVVRRRVSPGQPFGWALLREGTSAWMADADSVTLIDETGRTATLSLSSV